MDKLTPQVRLDYAAAAKRVAEIEKQIAPMIGSIQSAAGLTEAQEALAAIVDIVGESFATCEGCGDHIFDGDEYGTDDDNEVYACGACVERWGGAGWAERDDVEACAAAHDAKKAEEA